MDKALYMGCIQSVDQMLDAVPFVRYMDDTALQVARMTLVKAMYQDLQVAVCVMLMPQRVLESMVQEMIDKRVAAMSQAEREAIIILMERR